MTQNVESEYINPPPPPLHRVGRGNSITCFQHFTNYTIEHTFYLLSRLLGKGMYKVHLSLMQMILLLQHWEHYPNAANTSLHDPWINDPNITWSCVVRSCGLILIAESAKAYFRFTNLFSCNVWALSFINPDIELFCMKQHVQQNICTTYRIKPEELYILSCEKGWGRMNGKPRGF